MTGKAVPRTLRTLSLTEATLMSLFLEQSLHDEEAFPEIKLSRYVNDKLVKIKLPVSKVSRTVKFWTPCIYFDVLKRFIIAERTSNWSLHFESTLNILNLFISFDLISYAKFSINGIQHMQNFADQYPWLYEKFATGFDAVISQSEQLYP